jgi:hypothetical protein
MDADRLARRQQVQQRIDEGQHGRVLCAPLEHGPATDEGIDTLRSLSLEVVASLEAQIQIGLQRCAHGLDLGSIEHVLRKSL